MKRSPPCVGRLRDENKEWEMEPFLLDIVTPYLRDSVLEYQDYVSWHATCKTVWRHIGSRLYGEYLGLFLASCIARNKALYAKLPHVETYRRLSLLRIIERVCLLVGKSVAMMTNVYTFDYTVLTMFGSLAEHGFTSPIIQVDDMDVLDITAHYIREKYGWRFIIFRITKRTESISPRKVYGTTKEYGLALSPSINQDSVTARDDYSILKLRKKSTLS